MSANTYLYGNGNVPANLTKAMRGPISSLFNANQISAEDYARDLYKQSEQNAFNKEMVENQYQMTVNSMKNAGLNPILAFGSGAQNGSYGSSTGTPAGQGAGDMSSILSFVAQLGQIFAGLYTKNPKKFKVGFGN